MTVKGWISCRDAARLTGASPAVLRALARAKKLECRWGWHPLGLRPWYSAPELSSMVAHYISFPPNAARQAKESRARENQSFWNDAVSDAAAARFLHADESAMAYLLQTRLTSRWASPRRANRDLPRHEVLKLRRTLRKLAGAGKLKPAVVSSSTESPRNLWFPAVAIDRLVKSLTLTNAQGQTALSSAARSVKLAESRFTVGELITKIDAAFILGASKRGVEHLMLGSKPKLKVVKRVSCKREVFFDRSAVVALARRRATERRPRRPRQARPPKREQLSAGRLT